jgi:hypothetical protein
MDMEQQAEYANKECRAGAPNASFSEMQLASIRADFPQSPPMNTTGVGNLAYMAVHAPEDHRMEWKAINNGYTAFLKRCVDLA